MLQGFERTSDELRVELHLKPVPLERLRTLFDVGPDVGLCNAYAIDGARAAALQDLVSGEIDTEKYDFFLQRYA